MLISPIYGSRVYNRQNNNVQFTGLTRRMEREMYIDGKKDILEIINQREISGELCADLRVRYSENLKACNILHSFFALSLKSGAYFVPRTHLSSD